MIPALIVYVLGGAAFVAVAAGLVWLLELVDLLGRLERRYWRGAVLARCVVCGRTCSRDRLAQSLAGPCCASHLQDRPRPGPRRRR